MMKVSLSIDIRQAFEFEGLFKVLIGSLGSLDHSFNVLKQEIRRISHFQDLFFIDPLGH